ncbi:MAG TPA: ribosome maturation factor RimM [Candidatus Limnocylindrales bacterium]|jgi:16S rRNA processing protein RimM|nr:ribosome maturation factor RimM [Candidatus Limnocylindrales bacterium]
MARLVVGLVRGFHGLRGAVRIEVLTDDPERFARGSVVHPEGTDATLTIADVRDNRPPGLIVRFEEVPDRDTAESLRDVYLEADVAEAALPEGAHYWHDIVGSRVLTAAGKDLGEVVDVFRVGESEVYTVRGAQGEETLVPAVSSIVTELAPAEKRIVVDAVALGLEEPPTE